MANFSTPTLSREVRLDRLLVAADVCAAIAHATPRSRLVPATTCR